MSTVRIKSSRQLENFLRILAEESVGMAQAGMQHNEPQRQKDIIRRMQKDKNSLSEEDPEKEAPAVDAAPPAGDTKSDEKPAAPTPKDVVSSEIKPSLDAIIRAIKEIRSGFGADDSAIEQELSNYFDRLDEAEKISMIVLMRSVGDIMRRESAGAEAPDPGQYNIITSIKSGEEKSSSPPSAVGSEEPKSTSPPPAAGQEDTTPPIKVGEPISEAYRKRIRDLLSKNRG